MNKAETCWHQRFSEQPCQNPGTWRGDGNAALRAMVWCGEHKHANDVRIAFTAIAAIFEAAPGRLLEIEAEAATSQKESE